MKDMIPAAADFIEQHILDIILVVLLLFCMVIFIVLNDIKFPKSNATLQRIVVLENLENINDKENETSVKISEIETKLEKKANKKNICNGSLSEKNKACALLLKQDSCVSMDCCVWAKKNKTKNFRCVGGDAAGSTYDGENYDEYYYQNKRFGGKDNNTEKM